MPNERYYQKIDALVDKVEDWDRLSPSPLVSVWMITYNHETFIHQALDGILAQKVSFPYEIVIGEDKSTDCTREIVCEYQQRHPERIRLRLARENLFSRGLKPGMGVRAACRGKYIALCEGDDYWTDPLKLQKQVDFMEAHAECGECFHWAKAYDQSAQRFLDWRCGPRELKEYYTADDLLMHSNFIPTCSVVLRSNLVTNLPDWYQQCLIGDFPLHMIVAEQSHIGFIDEWMGVYRRHVGGIHGGSSTVANKARLLRVYSHIGKHMGVKSRFAYRLGVSKRWFEYASACRERGYVMRWLYASIHGVLHAPRSQRRAMAVLLFRRMRCKVGIPLRAST